MTVVGRMRGVCPCCASTSVKSETTVVSPFVAYRAWQGDPELTKLGFCAHCGFRFFDRGLSADESTRYYRNYRDGNYLRDRHRFEPFYTQTAHRDIAKWLNSTERRTALHKTLQEAGAPGRFTAALDHGGGDGGMLACIDADRKAVFDPSGSPAVAGVESISDDEAIGQEWHLAISCQVLEHLHDPANTLRGLRRALTPGGWLYVEVPDEIWRNRSAHGRIRDAWLRWLLKRRRLLIAADTLSTACRIKLGVLPPMGFVPMREHLNYFTNDALEALVRNSGFAVVATGINSTGQIFLVARKSTNDTDRV